MIYAVSLATKGMISPSFSYSTEKVINRGGGMIIRKECVKPKIKVLSFDIDRFKNSKLIITSIRN